MSVLRATWRRVAAARRRSTVIALAVLVVVAGGALLLALHPQSAHVSQPPTPPSPRPTAVEQPSSTTPPSKSSAATVTCRRPAPSPLRGADPQRVCIPSIKVDASIMVLGLNADHTVQVPPLSRVGDAGWYKYSATAGAVGPTVILGHVDSAQYGDGVFFRLGKLAAGDRVVVARDDGKVATFTVNRVLEVSKQKFPTQAVYGPTSTPTLRLVTCGGRFDSATGSYLDNIIVFASLQSLARL